MKKLIKSFFYKNTKNFFHLPKPGDKVGFSNEAVEVNNFSNFTASQVFEVVESEGNECENSLKLQCGTWLYTNQWKLLPKDTPLKC